MMKRIRRFLSIATAVVAMSAPAAFAQVQVSDISVEKTGPATAEVGTDVTYSITVTNNGPTDAASVTLTDTVPSQMSFFSGSQTSGPSFVCTFPSFGSGGTISCTGALPIATPTATFTFTFRIRDETGPSTAITNTANVSSPTDPNPGNNSSSVTTTTPPSSDLFVTKTGPAQAAADTDVTYNVTIQNLGPDPSSTVMLLDNTPAGMTFVSSTVDPSFICTDPGPGGTGPITCNSQTMAVGAIANFTFTFHIPPATAPGTTFTNIANVSSPTDDGPENNTASASTSTPPPPSADLAVTKNGPSIAGPDSDISYTITLFNGGPDTAMDVSLDDVLPPPLTFVSLSQDSGPTFSCSTPAGGANGTVTCTLAAFSAGASASFTITVHIPPATNGTFTNTATATTKTADPTPDNNSSTAATVVSATDVNATKTGPGTANAASNITYTITIGNAGPDIANNVTWSDPLPPGTTFVSLVQNNGPAVGCSTPAPGATGTINCGFILSVGGGVSAQFTLVINSGSAAVVMNTATATSSNFDTNPSNDSATATTTITQSADIGVAKSGPANATSGTDIQYTITVNNTAGPSNAANVTLTDTLPTGVSFVSMTQNTGPSFNCTNATCTIALLPVGSTATFTLVGHVASSVASGSSLLNTANVTTSTSDPNGSNNTATSTATTNTSADVSINKTGPSSAPAGTNVHYTVTVTNAGPSDAQNVSVTDVPGANGTFVSMTQLTGPPFACVSMTCTAASLAAGATATFDVVLSVSPTATGTIGNSANVTSTTTDPNPGNGTSSVNVFVDPGTTDMSITKTANGTQFLGGSNVTYTIAVTNNGPTTAANVVVTDTIPAGTSVVSATSTQGSCVGTAPVVCTIGSMNIGAQATITLVVKLPSTQGTFTNTAVVTAANTESNPANNTSSASVTVFSDVPALSPLALALFAAALAVVGYVVMRR